MVVKNTVAKTKLNSVFSLNPLRRYAALDKHKDSALGVVYVVDASNIKQGIRDTAEFLFKILSDPGLFTNNPFSKTYKLKTLHML